MPDGLRHAVGAEYYCLIIRHIIKLIDEYCPCFLETIDNKAVMYDFMAHVNRRTDLFEGALDDFDGPVDTGAESAWIGEEDFHACESIREVVALPELYTDTVDI